MDAPLTPESLLPMLAETMKFAAQSLSQSTALASVLTKKGVLTLDELNAAMKEVGDLKGELLAVMDAQIKKQN